MNNNLTIPSKRFNEMFENYISFLTIIQEALDFKLSKMKYVVTNTRSKEWFIEDRLLYIKDVDHTFILPSVPDSDPVEYFSGTINQYIFILVFGKHISDGEQILMLDINLNNKFL